MRIPVMPRGNRRDAARPSDQPDWDACIAWRRMLVALMNSDLPIEPVLKPFFQELSERAETLRDPIYRSASRNLLREARGQLSSGRYYEACSTALEARAIIERIGGVDRIELAGRRLCVFVRRAHPLAPPGFERTGRMKNADRAQRGRKRDEPAADSEPPGGEAEED